ncbi:MAG: pyridoxal phosphate-dependent aminotransferase [Butyrivibrio sp.]|nr:pyridoxal phosphate-dependent aminotransferase [Butyrivibrio sp.]
MISDKMVELVNNSSVIRAMFEEGKRLAGIYGAENVYDFSLGNPNVPAPGAVKEAIMSILEEEESTEVHGYMSNSGFEEVRQAIAASLNRRFKTAFNESNIIMTVGAAGGMNVLFKAVVNAGDEIIAFAPYFGEYRAYAANADANLIAVPPDTSTFQPNLEEFERLITPKTKAVIVNTPNNPTGVIYSEETIRKMAEIMERKQKEFGTVIILFSDEPYRELAYDGAEVPYLTKYYANTVVGYSYSKSLSLPGERIGYLVIPDELDDFASVKAACGVATRILGFVNAPSLMQKVIGRCVDIDVSESVALYNRNRETLYAELTKLGFECIKPEGAFYMFMKTPIHEGPFCKLAKEYNILLVPGSTFGCSGFVRIAYCVSYDTIVNSLPKFRELAEKLGLTRKQEEKA